MQQVKSGNALSEATSLFHPAITIKNHPTSPPQTENVFNVSTPLQPETHEKQQELLNQQHNTPAQSSKTASPMQAFDLHLPGLDTQWMSTIQQNIYMTVTFFAIGFSAIAALAIAILGLLPLDLAAYIFVWPSLIVWLAISIIYPAYGKLALKGFIIGILACLFYDTMRFTTIALGLWGDFIPRIGMWLLHTNEPNWIIGYIWRYVGDGGFMSISFVVGYHLLKPKVDVRLAALAFGIAIWMCLVATILIAPRGSEMLFTLTPVTFSLSLLGHIIYGLSIGSLFPLFINQKGILPSLSLLRA